MNTEIPTHPVQGTNNKTGSRMPTCVTMMAYEVYCHIHGPQEALVTGDCRGGFGVGELIAFLYARNFPKNEWRARAHEVFKGAKL